MEQRDVFIAYKGSERLRRADEVVADAVRAITETLAANQDVLPAKECAVAMKRMEGVLTALEAVFEGADWMCDGDACSALRREVADYRESLGVL